MTPYLVKRLMVASVAALTLAGCEEKEAPAPTAPAQPAAKAEQPAPAQISPEVMAEAREIFATRCTPCHGPEGKGDGPASAGLVPKPQNHTDPEWQKSVTDEHIEKIIQYGGPAVGKSPAMPPNPDLANKPVMKALRMHVRSLGQPK